MKSKIISTKAGHVVFREGRDKPFQICGGSRGRMRSFATIEAAMAAAEKSQNAHKEVAASIEKSRFDW
jgi:hypothetical protein